MLNGGRAVGSLVSFNLAVLPLGIIALFSKFFGLSPAKVWKTETSVK
jgi:uncharacterized membrane protein required for colicin V production